MIVTVTFFKDTGKMSHVETLDSSGPLQVWDSKAIIGIINNFYPKSTLDFTYHAIDGDGAEDTRLVRRDRL